jgi:hypothetical protein
LTFGTICKGAGLMKLNRIPTPAPFRTEKRRAGRRREGRLRLGLLAKLELVCGNETCEVVDLSATGARLRVSKAPRVGNSCILLLDTIEAFGSIVWSSGQLCGMKFDERLLESALIDFRVRREEIAGREQVEELEFARDWVEGRVR